MAIDVTSTKNELAAFYGTKCLYLSLHTGAAGSTGANEATGGTPAYGRQLVSWNAASNGTIIGNEVTFDVPAGTYVEAGLWQDQTGGTFKDTVAIQSTVLNGQGQVKVTPKFSQS